MKSIEGFEASIQAERSNLLNANSTYSSYNDRIAILDKQLKKAGQDFKAAYDDETLKHSVKYGHVSTPAYENKIKQLELKKDATIARLEGEIVAIREAMQNDPQVEMLQKQVDDKLAFKLQQQAEMKMKFKKQLDSLQLELNSHNEKFKEVAYELNQTERNKLKQQRDSVRAHPCP